MYGLMRAIVSHVDDPEKRGRIRAKIPDMFADPETGEVIPSPWIEAKSGQGLGVGSLAIPPVGSVIWVQCVYSTEEVAYDLVYETGGPVLEANGQSAAPPTSLGVDDESVFLKVGTPFKVPDPATTMRVVDIASKATRVEENKAQVELSLPNSANGGEYGKNRVIKTVSGFVFELDDTPGSARAQLHHPTGASVEINNAGVKTERWTKTWTEVADAATTRVGSDNRVRVDGHHLESVGKNKIEEIQGRLVMLAKEIQLESRLNLMLQASALHAKIRGKSRLDHIGGLEVTVGDAFNLSATSVSMNSLGSLAMLSTNSCNITGLTGVKLSTIPGLYQLSLTPAGVNMSAAIPGSQQLSLTAAGVDISPAGPGLPVAMAAAVVQALGLILAHTHPAVPGGPPVVVPSTELAATLPAAIAAVTSTNLRAL